MQIFKINMYYSTAGFMVWLNPWMYSHGYGGLTVKLHADFRPCSESAPLTLLHCSRVNCALLTTMQPGTMPLENLYPLKPNIYTPYHPGTPLLGVYLTEVGTYIHQNTYS